MPATFLEQEQRIPAQKFSDMRDPSNFSNTSTDSTKMTIFPVNGYRDRSPTRDLSLEALGDDLLQDINFDDLIIQIPDIPYQQQSSSPPSAASSPGTERAKVPRHMRECHKRAEIKRRCNIKGGLQGLQKLVPTISEGSGGQKDSESKILTKTSSYLKELVGSIAEQQTQIDRLKKEKEEYDLLLKKYNDILPEEGACSPPSTPPEPDPKYLWSKLNAYIKERCQSNWKFWIFQFFVRGLFETYMTTVKTDNGLAAFYTSIEDWLTEHCSLKMLRPGAIQTVMQVNKKTSLIRNPTLFETEVKDAIDNGKHISHNPLDFKGS